MVLNRTDDAEASVTRRSILKTGIAISAIGASGAATGIVQGDNANRTEATEDGSETHTLTVALTESGDAGIVSGEVTVGDQTKTTTPLNGDPARIQAEFEFENGTYSASGTSEINDETWRTKEKEVTIDGEDASLSLVLYPPGSDELDGNDDPGETDNDNSGIHTLTTALVESGDAGIVSGEVTVGDQTKTTTPLNGDPARIQAEFELENGTYSASGTSEINDETWRTKEKEVTIDGEDASLSLVLYPPGSDELPDDESEETKTRSNESSDESNQTDGTEDDTSDDTATDTSPRRLLL
ncbi:hypothetical protein ACFQL7_25260 [Halocatena marina]|uniref:Uncharacterized protein n=1 Tax=Halocatena marina TaxID=2934937 RepID=A0ABD5YU77_9EURY